MAHQNPGDQPAKVPIEEEDEDREEEELSRCRRGWNLFIRGLKKFIAFLFSHVGLASSVVGYTILGGILFMELEGPYEAEVRSFAERTKNNYTEKISSIFNNSAEDLVDRLNWLHRTESLLLEYEREIHRVTKEKNWDGKFGDEEIQWTFAGSLLFSVTVITTIGYGHIAPKTAWGKVVTIIYAIFGIPLTMLCLRDIGNLLAACFRIVYRQVCVNLTFHYIMLKRRRMKLRLTSHLQIRRRRIQQWAKKRQSEMSSVLRRDKRGSYQLSMTTASSQSSVNDVDVEVKTSSIMVSGSQERCHSEGMLATALKKLRPERKLSLAHQQGESDPFPVSGTSLKDTKKANHFLATAQLNDSLINKGELRSGHFGKDSLKSEIPDITPSTQTIRSTGLGELPVLVEAVNETDDCDSEDSSKMQYLREQCRQRAKLDRKRQKDFRENTIEEIEHLPPRDTFSSTGNASIELSSNEEIGSPLSASTGVSTSASSLSLNDFDEDLLVMRERLKKTRDLVPISVCLLLITGYIILGAVLFTLWEDDWDLIEGSYFCFITLTTIGFGDFVPGSEVTVSGSTEKRVLCMMYLLFGMAIIAMSFHLIQEEVKHKCVKIAIKLGLLEDRITRMLDRFTEKSPTDECNSETEC